MPSPHARWVLAATFVTLITVTDATRVTAQSIGAQFILAHSDHRLLGGLGGGGVLLTIPFRDRTLSSRLEVERVTGGSDRIGVACGSLPDPLACPTERVRDAGRSTGAAVGLEYRLMSHARVTLGVLARVRVAELHAETRGTESGNRISASTAVWGGELGALLGIASRPNAPLSFELGGTFGTLLTIRSEMVTDGYMPLDEDSVMGHVWLGITWRVGSR